MTRMLTPEFNRCFVTLSCLCGLLVGCGTQPQPRVAKREAFAVASPARSDATHERSYVGEVQAIRRVELRARVPGMVEQVAVDEGHLVEEGQLLFTVGVRALAEQLSQARAATKSAAAELKSAQIEQESTNKLFEKQIVARHDVALAEARVSLLEAKLEEARAVEKQAAISLDYARVRAPFAGSVNRLPKKVGSLVEENDLLTTLTDTREVFVYFRMSEQEYLAYTSERPESRPKEVSFRLANGELYASPGRVDAVENEIDRETGNIAFRARFPNEAGLLKHGSSGCVVVRATLAGGVVIPQAATFEMQDQLYVYTVDEQNVTHAQRVIPKLRLADSFVLESGLGPNDRFVTQGIQKLRHGMPIEVRPSDASAARTSI